MSLSMFFGRVVLPVSGLALAALLVWQVARTGSIELGPASMRGVLHWMGNETPPGEPLAQPAAPKRAARPGIMAEGRVVAYPGAEIIVGAETAGTIIRVLVQEKSTVRRGDPLVEFKCDELRASLDESLARVAEASTELEHQQKELARVDRLIVRQAGTDEERERIVSRLSIARSRRAAALAMVKRLDAMLAKTRIMAPIDGVVVTRMAHPGETLNVGTPLVKIVDLHKLRIEAEVDEYDISHCAPGSAVTIAAEGYQGKSWPGVLEEVADIVTGRRIRPEDPGRPTDSRVLPVRIAFLAQTSLKLGQRVEVEIFDHAARLPNTPRPNEAPSAATRPAVGRSGVSR